MTNQPSPTHRPEWQSDNGELWPDGWYICEKKHITGPFTLEEMSWCHQDKKEPKKWIARQGFSQWYDFQTLIEHKQEKTRKQSTPVIVAKQIFVPHQNLRKPEHHVPKVLKHEPELFPVQNQLSRTQQILLMHLTNKGRYRLGKIRSLWKECIFNMLITLFLYWGSWFLSVATEICLHLDHPLAEKQLKERWMIYVPFLHAIMSYRLAKLILQMEVQNGYQTVSPTLAFLFAFFPPLAMIYLQKAINKHWYLHGLYCYEKGKFN